MSGWSSGHDSVLAVNSLVEFALQEQVNNRKKNQENTKKKFALSAYSTFKLN